MIAQNYKIHSVTGDVKVKSGAKVHTATKGENLNASDILMIPKGGVIEILNNLDKRIYKSVRFGNTSVSKLIIDAREVNEDKTATLAGTGMVMPCYKDTPPEIDHTYK